MLIPVKQLYPIRLDPSATFTTQLETQLPTLPLLNPRIFFRNTSSSADVNVQISHILDLGTSADPLLTGTFSTVIVDQDVLADELLSHYFMEVALTDTLVRHEWTLTNLSASEVVIIQVWVEGYFEESLRDLPEYLPIII